MHSPKLFKNYRPGFDPGTGAPSDQKASTAPLRHRTC